MKKILLLLTIVLLMAAEGFSQAPGTLNYQGVARNSVGNVLANKNISLRLTIRNNTAAGPTVYQETRGVTTNPFGLFNVQLGSPGASGVTGTIAGVPWGVGAKFIQVEIDPNGGSTFINIGTAQLASVPYSLYSNLSGDLVLPFNKTQADAGTLFKITNSGTGSGSTALEGLTNSTAGNANGIIGTVSSTAPGSFSAGIRGINNSTSANGIGVYGSQAGSGWGVYGTAPSGNGVYGLSTSGTGVRGASTSGIGGYFQSTSGLALNTAGGIRLTGIGEGAPLPPSLFKILAGDAAGNGTWQHASAIGLVSGSGTLNYVPKWTPNGTTLGNSQIFDDGANVGIGTITPFGKFNVSSGAAFLNTNLVGSSPVGTWLSMGNTDPGGRWFSIVNTATANGEGPGKLIFFKGSAANNVTGQIMTMDHATSNVGLGTSSPTAKLHVTNAGTNISGLFNNTNIANTSNTVLVDNANISATGYGNNSLYARRGATLPNTFLWTGAPTAITGSSSNGFGVQGTSATGFGLAGLSYNGTGIQGINLNAGNAARFENAINATNAAPVVAVNNISTLTSAYGVHSIIASASPGAFSSAIRGQNNGTGGSGIGVYGSQAGSGWGVYGNTPSGIGVHGYSDGGVGVAGYSNNTGRAADFAIQNATNTNAAVIVRTDGLGKAGYFNSTNAANVSSVLHGLNPAANAGSWGVLATSVSGTGYPGEATHAAIVAQATNGVGIVTSSTGNYGLRVGAATTDAVYAETYSNTGNTAIRGVGLFANSYGVVGQAATGTGAGGYFTGGTTALRTLGGVQLTGINEGANRILTTTSGTGEATWEDAATVGLVSGTGVATRVAFWNSASSLSSNNDLYWNNVNSRLGVGTNTPVYDIHISRNTEAGIQIDNTGPSGGNVWLGTPSSFNTGGVGTLTNHDFPIFTNNTDRMIVKTNGFVGIGTAAPVGKIHTVGSNPLHNVLDGSSTLGTWLSMGNSAGGNWFNIISTGSANGEGAGKLIFMRGAAAGTIAGNIMTFEHATSNVGINTVNPTATLDVNGTFKLTDGTQGANKVLVSDAAGNASWNARIAFKASSYSGGAITTVGTTLVVNTELYDEGNGYDPTTGIFTAPAAGLYHFDAGVRGSNANFGRTNFCFRSNLQSFFGCSTLDVNASNQTWSAITINSDIILSAGETVELIVEPLSGSFTPTTLTNYVHFNGHRIH